MGCTNLSRIEFESDSKLRHIERSAFSSCRSLLSICLPPQLATIDDYGLMNTNLEQILLVEGHQFAFVLDDFLVFREQCTVRFFMGFHGIRGHSDPSHY
jgi:hypothetical protein